MTAHTYNMHFISSELLVSSCSLLGLSRKNAMCESRHILIVQYVVCSYGKRLELETEFPCPSNSSDLNTPSLRILLVDTSKRKIFFVVPYYEFCRLMRNPHTCINTIQLTLFDGCLKILTHYLMCGFNVMAFILSAFYNCRFTP
jgi:hypothetical protein